MTTHGFRHTRDGGVKLTLPEYEAALLTNLAGQLIAMLAEDYEGEQPSDSLAAMLGPGFGTAAPKSLPDDPVMARLLPDAYEDADASAEFRRFTEHDLRTGKLDRAQTMLRTLGEGGSIRLNAEEASAWLGCLNDLRLALGTRLEVTEDDYENVDENDPRWPMFSVYDWLTYLQNSLILAIED